MNFYLSLTRTPWLTALSGFALTLLFSLTLSLFGWFFPLLTIFALVLLFGSLGIALFALFQKKDYFRLVLIGALILFSFVILLRVEPSIFTGRDQGSIGLAAWNLAQNHELAFRSPMSDAFFNIYGPGRALNFPGFAYTETGALITQFPLGYTSYLALFVSWFGIFGLLIGNGLLFILSGWSFFELLRLFVARRSAAFGTLLFATSFIVIWLTELALTENLALLLYLVLAGALVRLEREDDARFIPLVVLASFLFALTRIEGFVIAAIALGTLLLRPRLRFHLFSFPKIWTVPAVLFFVFLFLRDLFMNLPFYTMIGKAAMKYGNELTGTSLAVNQSEPALGPILFSYGLFPIFLLGIAALLFGLMKRRFGLLIPFLLAAPTLMYLINGHISDDHPWLLRRYAFTLFPLFLLSTMCLMEELGTRLSEGWKNRIVAIAFSLLLAFQCWPALQALQIREQDDLLEQTSYLGTLFTERDLILIDRGASGDPFALLAGPLSSIQGKNAVYFFNPEDYARLDRSAFDRVYLITAGDALGRYLDAFPDSLLPVQTISFSSPTLTTNAPYSFPTSRVIASDALLFQITD